MGRCRDKLRSESGIGLIFVVLIVAIAAVCASILYLGYQQHMKNERRFFDEVTVDTAERVAKESYILDLKDGGVTYYYNGIHRTVTEASEYKGKIDIEGYGRSFASENKNGETGAIGIPNKGGKNGAQILAVCVEADGTIHSRWQGHYLTAEDYELMTREERDRLTIDQLNQIDADLIYELGRSGSETESEDQTESKAEDSKSDPENSEVDGNSNAAGSEESSTETSTEES